MRKTLREIFAQATPEELGVFIGEYETSGIPEQAYSSIKEKVYLKTGIMPKKKLIFDFCKKHSVVLAASVLLCTILGIFAYIKWWKVPVWEGAQYTAAQIADFFQEKTDGSTKSYTTVYVPESQYLYIEEIQNTEYLNIYRYEYKQKSTEKSSFEKFVNSFLGKASKSLGCGQPQYEIEERESLGRKGLEVYTHIGEHRLLVNQSDNQYRVALMNNAQGISLDGEMVMVDQRMSDKEILSSIQSIKDKLFLIFGLSFSDAKIVRTYRASGEYGVNFLTIYFYNVKDHDLNRTHQEPVSDYISIEFDNFKNYDGDMVSDGVLKNATIRYVQNQKNVSEVYKTIAKAKRISLEEAEELLLKGYVFGGHACPLCMAGQDTVSFEGYEFVDIEYIFRYDMKTYQMTDGIPFYAFYKLIGTDQTGRQIYAKTYVPAIKVNGYEAYFEAQTQEHRQW